MIWLCVIGAGVLFMLAIRLGRAGEQWVLSGSEFDMDGRQSSCDSDSEADEEWAILLAATEEEHRHHHSH